MKRAAEIIADTLYRQPQIAWWAKSREAEQWAEDVLAALRDGGYAVVQRHVLGELVALEEQP